MVCRQCGSGAQRLLPKPVRKLMGRDTSGSASPYWQVPILFASCASDMVIFFPPMFIVMVPR